MANKNQKCETVAHAVNRLYATCEFLASQGFVLTGAMFVVKPKGDFKQNAVKHVTDDGRVGTVRIMPPDGMKPPAEGNGGPLTPLKAAVVVTASAIASGAVTAAVHAHGGGKPVMGEICKNCGGANLQRMGTCLYCQDCGESNGCS